MSRRKSRRLRKIRQKFNSIKTNNRLDFHHILFQQKHWNSGFAKALRQHPYMGKMIPQRTLHSEIHSKIHDIPTPNGAECKAAYLELLRREQLGLINVENDSLEVRISFLIEVWEDICPATVAMLKWQREVVSKFYAKGD